jgi:hypothetical protein
MWRHVVIYTTAFAAAGYAQNATSAPAINSTVECFDGLKMFVSRGTSEPLGTGETGKVVEKVAARINGSEYEANPYPASGDDPNYFISVANGTASLKQLVVEYAEACPGSKMALFGYSQVRMGVWLMPWIRTSGLHLHCDVMIGRASHQQHTMWHASGLGSVRRSRSNSTR